MRTTLQRIDLDHNATTPLWPEVAEAMLVVYRGGSANPASQHAAGRAARRIVESAREAIGHALGARLATHAADRVVFTSGGTESNHLAILGLGLAQEAKHGPGRIVVSGLEHPSLVGAAEQLVARGWERTRLSATSDGVVRLDELEHALSDERTRLVSVMMANHETGAVQPVVEAARLCRAAGVLFHTDAVQAVGKLPVDFQTGDFAALSASAHKIGGPVGIGALVVRHDVPLVPLLVGGFQQQGIRAGTEPTALIAGLRRAVELWEAHRAEWTARLVALRARFESALVAQLTEIVIHAAGATRLPQTSNMAFIGVERQSLVMALDQAGVCCSTGSACASGSSEPSPVLRAMGLPTAQVESAVRFSFGPEQTSDDIDAAVERVVAAVRTLRGR